MSTPSPPKKKTTTPHPPHPPAHRCATVAIKTPFRVVPQPNLGDLCGVLGFVESKVCRKRFVRRRYTPLRGSAVGHARGSARRRCLGRAYRRRADIYVWIGLDRIGLVWVGLDWIGGRREVKGYERCGRWRWRGGGSIGVHSIERIVWLVRVGITPISRTVK